MTLDETSSADRQLQIYTACRFEKLVQGSKIRDFEKNEKRQGENVGESQLVWKQGKTIYVLFSRPLTGFVDNINSTT